MISRIQSCTFLRKKSTSPSLKANIKWEQGIYIAGYVNGKHFNTIIAAEDLKPVPTKEMRQYDLDSRICLEAHIEGKT